jgi:uncharacterized protein (TIGR02598 family)
MAMGLVTFCLVAMMGMLPVGLKQERAATEQMAAMQVLAAVENDFQNLPAAAAATKKFKISTELGDKGAFYVDGNFEWTDQKAAAEYNVQYEIAGEAGINSSRRMYMMISRALHDESTKGAIIAEGIVQERVN